MSPASKLKSNDKLAARTVKEQKTSLKSTHAPANNGSGIPGSAYNLVLGTFHEQSASLPSPQNSGRFRNIDETDDHSGSSLGTSAEYDSLSNNDSCSGESEDNKEKTKVVTIPQTESVPGCDTDKRDKVRQKNEKKHQRQKERRAQELHERCNSFLMSRKLEALAQKFVAMGISSERATMALILNEGRVEESVAWLFEENENGKQQSVTNLDGADLKIDIAEELAQIAALEVKYYCTKHEVERAVVACDGDLEKAEDALKVQKQEPTVVVQLREHSGGPVAAANGLSNKLLSPEQNSVGRISAKGSAPTSIQQQGRAATVPYIELANRNMHASRNIPTKQERATPQVAAFLDKRQPTTNSSPSASYSSAPPLLAAIPQTNPEVRHVTGRGHEVKINMQAAAMLKEPIVVLQRPQSNALRQKLPSTNIGLSVSPPGSTGWYPNNTPSEVMKTASAYGGLGHKLRNPSLGGSAVQQLYPQNQYQQFVSGPMEPGVPQWSSARSTTGTSSIRTSSSIALPSSLGLFTGWGSSASGSSSSVNWSTGGLMSQCDYNSIDWTLDSTLLRPALNSSNQLCESDAWSRTFMSTRESRPVNNSGVYLGGLQEGKFTSAPASEWTSAFNGRDLFGAPRQFVTYPSL